MLGREEAWESTLAASRLLAGSLRAMTYSYRKAIIGSTFIARRAGT